LELAAPLAQARWLPPEVVSVSGVRVAPHSEAVAVVGSHGPAVPRAEEAVSDAVVQPREVEAAELDAAAVPQQAAVLDGAAVLQQAAAEAAVWGAAAEPQRAVEQVVGSDVAEPRRAAPVASAQRPAAGPSAVLWVVRRGRLLPWPARRRAARSAHAMRMPRAASRSERSSQAARCEGLS
jgi:hypothetical protein